MINLVKNFFRFIGYKNLEFKFQNLFLVEHNYSNFYLTTDTLSLLSLEKVTNMMPNDNLLNVQDNFKGTYDHKLVVFPKKQQNNIVEKVNGYNKNISISEKSEKELLKKLDELEKRQYYLKPEFSLRVTAKKIKTNTTYLSYVVNKNYNKTFSAYYNELRINYVINEIIHNKTFREYSTQAIAESAGFKNADSFASSFKKKAGVTPFQFIIEIKKRNNI